MARRDNERLRYAVKVRHAFRFLVGCAVLLLTTAASAQQKFALQLFHYNLQYVCGGTIGFTPAPSPEIDLDNDTIEDRIITESFAPIVELFAQHPNWGVDLEMQGYMIDVMAARHPEVLDQLRTIAKSGQVDVVSFHYSDQLYIGYPQEDWSRSQALTADVFEAHDIPLSRTVFCQEGQAAQHMAGPMADRGYRNMVWPKNLWLYQHGDFTVEPYYQFGDIFLVPGPLGINYDDGTTAIEVTWTFLDDGELLATGDLNPYFPEIFFVDPAEVAEYESRLMDLESQGFTIATVDQYIEAISGAVAPAALPPLLDGTWQPNSTGGVKRWMGGKGLWWQQERDNHVRTLGAVAHREMVAAETIAAAAGIDAREELDSAWRMMFLGQVTDATGINPFRGEIQYGISHLAEATRIAREVISRSKDAMSMQTALIMPGNDSVEAAGADATDGWSGSEASAQLELAIDAGDREVSQSWEQVAAGHHRLVLDFSAAEGNIRVTFPGALEDSLSVGLALNDEQPSVVTRSDFSFEVFHFALPTGYIGLGEGRFLIKDMGHVHLAAEVKRDSGEVVFIDETAPPEDTQRWVFHLFEGTAEQAAALAIELNSSRRLVR